MGSKKTVKEIKEMKSMGEKITMLTAYDASMASTLYGCGTDILLVGDSLGMVVLGYDSTVPVSMEEMLHHCKAVRRGAPDAFIVGDMPFGSYQLSTREALLNGIRFMKEAGVDAVKLEGGVEVCETIQNLVKAGIPVMGHIGLTPQTASQMGGYKLQGKDDSSARRLLQEARSLEEAGVFSIVLECIPAELADVLSSSVGIATIGIGAGAGCDGQVLVVNDLLGMFDRFTPKFVKQYGHLSSLIKEAVTEYVQEVKTGKFPDDSYSFSSDLDFISMLDSK